MVFLPGFEGHRFVSSGRWSPSGIVGPVRGSIISAYPSVASAYGADPWFSMGGGNLILLGLQSADLLAVTREKNSIEYAQTGLRFTTTVGPADLGVQYFFGNYFRPSFSLAGIPYFLDDLIQGNIASLGNYSGNFSLLKLDYNRYHQLGVDWAQVIGSFNVRAELAAHITSDLAGDAGWVRNPFIGWSAGFDRDLVWGINMNFQCNETVRLFNDKNTNPAVNVEGNTPFTATRLTLILSKKLLRDNLELKFTGIFDPEDRDLYLIPSVALTFGEVVADFSAGIFAGKDGGEFSQYRNNGYIKAALTYTF
jgi:hypothetical protein